MTEKNSYWKTLQARCDATVSHYAQKFSAGGYAQSGTNTKSWFVWLCTAGMLGAAWFVLRYIYESGTVRGQDILPASLFVLAFVLVSLDAFSLLQAPAPLRKIGWLAFMIVLIVTYEHLGFLFQNIVPVLLLILLIGGAVLQLAVHAYLKGSNVFVTRLVTDSFPLIQAILSGFCWLYFLLQDAAQALFGKRAAGHPFYALMGVYHFACLGFLAIGAALFWQQTIVESPFWRTTLIGVCSMGYVVIGFFTARRAAPIPPKNEALFQTQLTRMMGLCLLVLMLAQLISWQDVANWAPPIMKGLFIGTALVLLPQIKKDT